MRDMVPLKRDILTKLQYSCQNKEINILPNYYLSVLFRFYQLVLYYSLQLPPPPALQKKADQTTKPGYMLCSIVMPCWSPLIWYSSLVFHDLTILSITGYFVECPSIRVCLRFPHDQIQIIYIFGKDIAEVITCILIA